jgi:hypothetical protein
VPYVDFTQPPIALDPFGRRAAQPGFPLPTEFIKLIHVIAGTLYNASMQVDILPESRRAASPQRSLAAFISGQPDRTDQGRRRTVSGLVGRRDERHDQLYRDADAGALTDVSSSCRCSSSIAWKRHWPSGSVGALGGKMTLPAGILQLSASPLWPASVTIEGQGKEVTIVRISGAVNGLNAHDAGPTYAHQSGRLKDLTVQGAAGALVGVDVNFRNMPRLEKVRVTGFARQGVYFNNCIMPKLDHSLVQACGGASFAQVEVENSTTFLWDHSYISGGNVTTIAGIAIDKTTSFIIIGGASESTGIPIRLCGKADAVIGTNAGLIWGIDLENPNNGADCYIELGAGWTGAQYQGVTRLTVGGVNQSPSGSATVKYGIKAQNTDTVHLLPNKWGTPAFGAGGVSNVELVGVNNIRWSATPQSSNLGAGLFYVRENGAERKDAKPYQPWEQGGRNLVLAKQVAVGATPDCAGASYLQSSNGGATTVLNFTGGVVDGQLLIFGASDAVTTIKHNNGGVGSVWLFDQKDHLLRGGDTLVFIYDLANTMWRQIGHSVSTLGPGTGDNVLMTNAAGQISFIANGTEADISFNITPKGAGFVKLNITSQFGALRVGAVAGGNYMEVYPNVAGSPPRMDRRDDVHRAGAHRSWLRSQHRQRRR